MELAGTFVKDVTVLRRMIFATAYLPQEVPHYWDIVAHFCCIGSKSKITSDQVKLLMENLQFINKEAFTTDLELTREVLNVPRGTSEEPLGIVLISKKQACRRCGGKLLLRQDRPSRVTLFTQTV